jgi:hypothetical protein
LSLHLTELNALQLDMPALTLRAYRLRCRANVTRNPVRAQMLRTMSDAYMSFGLAQTHADFGVAHEAVEDLRQGGIRKLRRARALAKMGV